MKKMGKLMAASVFANCNTSAMRIDFNCSKMNGLRSANCTSSFLVLYACISQVIEVLSLSSGWAVGEGEPCAHFCIKFLLACVQCVFDAHSGYAPVYIYLAFIAVIRINIIGCLVSHLISRDSFLFTLPIFSECTLFHFSCVKYANASYMLLFSFRKQIKYD